MAWERNAITSVGKINISLANCVFRGDRQWHCSRTFMLIDKLNHIIGSRPVPCWCGMRLHDCFNLDSQPYD